jgi:osmotically-inducible protein OsmY
MAARRVPAAGLLLVTLLFAVAAGAVPTDGDMRFTVARELDADPLVPDSLRVGVERGIVTLSGQVGTPFARVRALRKTKAVRGVRAVVDLVEVLPEIRPDPAIRQDVEARLAAQPATEADEVQVRVDAGVVTLAGRVDSVAEKELVRRYAAAVPGVTGVVDRLLVDAPEERPDAEIAAELRALLHWDLDVRAEHLEVAVEGGVVHLSGSVGSEQERRRAMLRSWVPGVRDVAAEALRVVRLPGGHMTRPQRFPRRSDTALRLAVVEAIAADPRVPEGAVPEVTAEDAVVRLSGALPTLAARRAAEQDAGNTVGVWRVDTRLRVEPPGEVDPADLRGRVQAAFSEDALLADDLIRTRFDQGRLRLTGVVDSVVERIRAERLAARIEGVREIDNRLEPAVPVEALTYAGYDENWHQALSGWPRGVIHGTRTDAEIARGIAAQIEASPLVDLADIEVRVDDGVAVLEGRVPDSAARRAALENAWEGGAYEVIDRLEVPR